MQMDLLSLSSKIAQLEDQIAALKARRGMGATTGESNSQLPDFLLGTGRSRQDQEDGSSGRKVGH